MTNKDFENSGRGGDGTEDSLREIEFPPEGYVQGDRFNASVPLDVPLLDVDKNYVELSMRNGKVFARVFFDSASRFVYIVGGGQLVCTFNQPFVIGKKSLQYYPGFFGDIEDSVSDEYCVVSVSDSGVDTNGESIYPIIKIENRSPNGTFYRVFQNPNPPSSQTPAA